MFTSDDAMTAQRFDALDRYFADALLDGDDVVCRSLGECRRSATTDGAGARKVGVEFAPGQLPHVGPHFDLQENGRPMRVLVVGMETGRGDVAVSLQRRREQVAASTSLSMTRRNAHMQGVMNALRLVMGRPIGTDRPGELLDLGTSAAHMFDAFALTNIRLCSAYATGSTDSRGTPLMTRNCLRHLAATVQILQPTLCVLQGAPLGTAIAPLIDAGRELGPNLRRVDLAGVDTMVASFTHPTARGPHRWGGVTNVPYLHGTVVPALRLARAEIVGTAGRPSAPVAPTRASVPPEPGREVATTQEVAAAARRIVADEIERRGGTVREAAVGRRTELRVTLPSGEAVEFRVTSKRRGDWQISIREGDSTGGASNRFWVFVDLEPSLPVFYVVPDRDAVDGIRTRHAAYLAANGGRRVINDSSLHQAIKTRHVVGWLDRWDLIGL